jgi:hypothetical protein
MNKYAYIDGDIHVLMRMKKGEDFSKYAWRIHYQDDLWFVPVKDECKDGFTFKPEIYRSKRIRWNYHSTEVQKILNNGESK